MEDFARAGLVEIFHPINRNALMMNMLTQDL